MIFAVEVNAVERFLEGILVESGAEVVSDFGGRVERDVFAKGDEGINDFSFVDAHDERSREQRNPHSTWCRGIAGAARLSARSGWAKVKALLER